MTRHEKDATYLLTRARAGDESKVEELFRLLYDELRALAGRLVRRSDVPTTLQPTALVNEAFLRLIRADEIEWADRTHFMAVAARCIRQILTDHARRRGARKRGGDLRCVTLHEAEQASEEAPEVDLVALDRALEELKERSERQARVIELRFFGGLTVEDVAAHLGVSERTVRNDWRFAKAWLFARLQEELEP